MHELPIDRRNLLAGGTALAAGVALAGPALAQGGPTRAPYAPEPAPLPFDPKAIPGLSERLLTSHHANNYTGAVRRLAGIHAQINALDPASAPGFQLNGLKREELIATNSMILHEHYFGNMGASGSVSPALGAMIERDFGSKDRWLAEFSGMGKALGGGSGWVVLQYSARDRRLVNQWANDHTMALFAGAPILVLDMFEHAYAMDYGARAAAYVDAFMKIINWDAANTRFAKAIA
jgi:Fe-Mn family superoxide dismutase